MATAGNISDPKSQAEIVAKIIPPLDHALHKGCAGRIGVIGGCREYSGAPYFAAISALKVGCDLSHVYCYSEASPVIKSYSPELIVHPVLDQPDAVDVIMEQLPRLHSLVIGPGLGRSHADFTKINAITKEAQQKQLPIVFDADALFYIASNPNLVSGYTKAILTPNVAEFHRLSCMVLQKETHSNLEEDVKNLAAALGNVTIVLKGERDYISDGKDVVSCSESGSARRCGGQGDLLSGSLGVFNFWSHSNITNCPLEISAPVVAGLGACLLTRRCNRLAFAKYSRSMTTSDMIAEIHNAFSTLFSM